MSPETDLPTRLDRELGELPAVPAEAHRGLATLRTRIGEEVGTRRP